MTRFLYLFLGTLSFILLGQLFGGSYVSAATVYDDKFLATPTIKLYCLDRAAQDRELDITTTWPTFFEDRLENLPENIRDNNAYTKYKQRVTNNQGGYMVQVQRSNYTVTPEGFVDTIQLVVFDSIDPTLEFGGYYDGSQMYGLTLGNITSVSVVSIPVYLDYGSNGKYCEEKNGAMGAGNNLTTVDFNYSSNMPNSLGKPIWPGSVGVAQPFVFRQTTSLVKTQYFIIAANLIYPEGYEGPIVNDKQPDPPRGFKPFISWSISSTGVFEASYDNNGSVNLDGIGKYSVSKLDKDWKPPVTELNTSNEEPFWQSKYKYDKLSEKGYYSLIVAYQPNGGIVAPDGFSYVETVVFQIQWDGKSMITGNNVHECEKNICNNSKDGNEILNVFNGLNIETFGIQEALLAPLYYISRIPEDIGHCRPLQAELFNRPIVFECGANKMDEVFPFLEIIWHVFLNGLAAYFVAMKIMSLIKNAHKPEDDGIEVLKL